MRPTISQKRARFAELHASPGCFVMPNPFDIGSAKYLASLGFPALATTSAGMAFAAGRPDGGVDRAYALSHIRDLAHATDLPLNADFEAGFARDAEGVHESARLCVGAGVAGFSIEDYTGDPKAPLYALSEAVERLRAARAAINATGEKVLLTARSEAILRQAGGLPEALRRLAAYAEAGADVLYAPGIRSRDDIAAVVQSVDRPVNVLMGMGGIGLTRDDLSKLGVKRISVGGALSRVALGAFLRAAREMREHGTFTFTANAASMAEITAMFAE